MDGFLNPAKMRELRMSSGIGGHTVRRKQFRDQQQQYLEEFLLEVFQDNYGCEAQSFDEAIHDGIILCQIVNDICPGLVTRYTKSPKMIRTDWQRHENITLFVQGCRKLKVPEELLVSSDDVLQRRSNFGLVSLLLLLLKNVKTKKRSDDIADVADAFLGDAEVPLEIPDIPPPPPEPEPILVKEVEDETRVPSGVTFDPEAEDESESIPMGDSTGDFTTEDTAGDLTTDLSEKVEELSTVESEEPEEVTWLDATELGGVQFEDSTAGSTEDDAARGSSFQPMVAESPVTVVKAEDISGDAPTIRDEDIERFEAHIKNQGVRVPKKHASIAPETNFAWVCTPPGSITTIVVNSNDILSAPNPNLGVHHMLNLFLWLFVNHQQNYSGQPFRYQIIYIQTAVSRPNFKPLETAFSQLPRRMRRGMYSFVALYSSAMFPLLLPVCGPGKRLTAGQRGHRVSRIRVPRRVGTKDAILIDALCSCAESMGYEDVTVLYPKFLKRSVRVKRHGKRKSLISKFHNYSKRSTRDKGSSVPPNPPMSPKLIPPATFSSDNEVDVATLAMEQPPESNSAVSKSSKTKSSKSGHSRDSKKSKKSS